ncbi:hypothetical protein EV424DRAFT_1525877 [Suillus variegatus]|nr:hypothetical protein EV424DRAFT_1525877 [Suillus variegatus]
MRKPQTVRVRTKLSLRSIRHVGSSRDKSGLPVVHASKVLKHRALVQQAATCKERREIRLQAMTADERRALENLRLSPAFLPGTDEDLDDFSFGEILNGADMLPISHAGGEFDDLARGVLGDVWKVQDSFRSVRRVDNRTRRDRVLRRNIAFSEQIPAMTEAYLEWCLEKSQMGFRSFFDRLRSEESGTNEAVDKWSMTIVDVFCILPCSPISPMVGITTEALEIYRVAHLRCPHLSIQAFVKTICDLHGVDFHRHLSRQFSISFDLYLEIRRNTDAMVMESLGRDSPHWRLRTCLHLTFTMLYAMDGNDSLKRVLRRSLADKDDTLGASSEVPTGQSLKSDRYLSRNFVDNFTRDLVCTSSDKDAPVDDSCEGHWENMDTARTNKAWGIYDETGIFVAVCRHGFCLLIADMVQSGELAKYPLAVVAKLLDVFGGNLGGGYDIGCQFKTTLNNSTLGPLARSLNHTCLVGAFHGHAHRRLCQLVSLTTYIKGLGIEDLETCERTFSKSNSLALSLRYASVFHRQQSIDSYFEHNDNFEVYANLLLPKLMQDIGVVDTSVFELWLEEEKAYLKGLTREPDEETLQMEYWQRLVNLNANTLALQAATAVCQTPSHHDTVSYDSQTRNTRKAESARRHALEDYDKNMRLVQALECKLKIVTRWVPEDAEWQRAGRLVVNRKYQRALDRLEGLIVARIFELTKMNRAGTGYKLRKHIAKALQTRSVAIRSALSTYNAVASVMSPPHKMLKWEEVVDYAFLADFDLLRDARADISQSLWSSPAARSAMDLHFKICRAREEISQLNIEVCRLVTYIRDEDNYLRVSEEQLKNTNPGLAHQISIVRNIRGRFNSHHLKRLQDISQLSGFSGTLTPGSASVPAARVPANMHADHISAHTLEDLEEEEVEDEIAEEASRRLQDVLFITEDLSWLELSDHADLE